MRAGLIAMLAASRMMLMLQILAGKTWPNEVPRLAWSFWPPKSAGFTGDLDLAIKAVAIEGRSQACLNTGREQGA